MTRSLVHGKIPIAILEVLATCAPMTNSDLCARVQEMTGCSPGGIRKAIWELSCDGILFVDKSRPKKHLYSIAIDEPLRSVVPPDRFKIPEFLQGPVLSPIEWVARQLGVV